MITRMTAAWGANVTNLLAFLGVFIAALCIFAVGVGFFTDRTFLDSFGLAFTLAIDVYIVWVAAFWLYNRRVSGAVLLDCGPHKGKAIFLLFATFLFFRELLSVISASGAFSVETVQELLFAAFFLLLGVRSATDQRERYLGARQLAPLAQNHLLSLDGPRYLDAAYKRSVDAAARRSSGTARARGSRNRTSDRARPASS